MLLILCFIRSKKRERLYRKAAARRSLRKPSPFPSPKGRGNPRDLVEFPKENRTHWETQETSSHSFKIPLVRPFYIIDVITPYLIETHGATLAILTY